ncbi:MAG: hypothetical protein JSV65_11730 [Armatimonadota bacterium]|nr:MAG: hypothetical protein JSV65_11730 [Armatimonadota bacterium]
MGCEPKDAEQGGWKVSALPLLKVHDSREWRIIEIERPDGQAPARLNLAVEVPSRGWSTRLAWPKDEIRARVEIPCTDSPAAVSIRWGRRRDQRLQCQLPERRRWRIHLLHHTHVDIGYTDLPSRVCEQHAEILDQVVELCERTREHPEPARFRWTNECFWPVVNYARRRAPRQLRTLIRWMRRGAIENTALYMNMTELWTEEMIARSLCRVVEFSSQHRLPLEVGAQTDCPGVSWAVPQLLNQIGIRYLAMSSNSIRARVPRLPRPFWWRTPSGRVLVWNTDPDQNHYGEGYRHGFRYGYAEVLERLPQVLARYEDQGYPYSVYGFRLAMDNCYPLAHLSDLVREWNDTWAAPQLRISTFREFFRELEPRLSDCDEVEGAWPDWWADGHASAARHTSRARRLWRRLDRFERAQAVLAPEADGGDVAEQALEDLVLFDEHTWGARGGTKHPYSPATTAHWAEKELSLFHAEGRAEDMRQRLGERLAGGCDAARRFVVMNTSLHPRAPLIAVADLGAPNELQFTGGARPLSSPKAAQTWAVADVETGAELPCQMLHTDHADPQRRGEAVVVIPEMDGLRTRTLCAQAAKRSRRRRPMAASQVAVKSPYYVVAWTQQAGITAWRDIARKREWLTPGLELGRLVLERALGRDNATGGFRHFRASDRSPAVVDRGPVFDSLTWTEALEGTAEVILCARLYHVCPRLEFVVRVNKPEVLAPEALFISFPFEAARPEFLLHYPGGAFRPDAEQLPGSARDYYHVEAGLVLTDGEDWLALASPDAPLFHLQEPNTARWLETLDVRTGHVFSNPMSNYWHTNFRPSQSGWVELNYVLTSGCGDARSAPLRALNESLADPVVFPGRAAPEPPPIELLDGTADLLSLRRDGEGFCIRIKETLGQGTRCALRFPRARPSLVERTDPCGGRSAALGLRGNDVDLALGPYETVTLRARFDSGQQPARRARPTRARARRPMRSAQ